MNKTEKALVDAIESKDYDKSVKALSKFTDLKSTTDKQANFYFDKVESLNSTEEAVEEVEVEPVVEEVEEEVVEEVSAPRVENRGKKAKSIGRKEIESKFNEFLVLAVNYQAQAKKELNADSSFALKLVRRLSLLKKQLLR